MTQTLRRERKQKFSDILMKHDAHPRFISVNELAEILADASMSQSELTCEALSKTSIEAAIWAGTSVTQEMADSARVRQEAPIEFERALGFSKPLPWTVDKDWQNFAEWVVEKYQSDQKVFQRYETWRSQPFVRGAIDNKRLRGFVHEFYDSFDMFKKQDKPEEAVQPVKKVVAPDEGNFVPNPFSRKR